MSTFAVIYLLDQAIFNPNLSAGIVSYSLEHAQHIFKRIIGHALDSMPDWAQPLAPVIQRSAREITFKNGSFLRVDTTLRGGAYQLVLVSEYGKTCARNPLKAEEVITGTLQTVPINGRIIIESTGEGNSGFYAEMCQNAVARGNDNLALLEYKMFFFPWYLELDYQMDQAVSYGVELTDYMAKIEKETGVNISQKQRYWYAHQKSILGEKIKQEFPSTISEAFLSSSDAYYFQLSIEKAYQDHRCLQTNPYDPLTHVYVAMDIGVNDLTVMAFFQIVHGEIRFIDYYEDKNKGVDFYARYLQQDKKYLYHTIFLPHDAAHRDGIVVENTYQRDFQRLFAQTNTKFIVLKRTDKNLQISNAKIKFDRCVFNLSRVKPFLDQLGKYRKKWSEQYGKYEDSPHHGIECFIGETLVETDIGEKRIDQISIGDKVITPNGLRLVKNVFKHKTKELIMIEKGDSSIICTPHHKVFTKKGLIKASSLTYNSYVLTKNEEDIWKRIGLSGEEKGLGFKDYFVLMSQGQLSSLMGTNTNYTSADIIEEQSTVDCIGICGPSITEKFLKAITFIISMGTQKIMTFQTCNACQGMNISKCTTKFGRAVKKDKDVLRNEFKVCWIKESSLKKHVEYAVRIMKPYILGLFYVRPIAIQSPVHYQEKILNQEPVSNAFRSINAINTAIKNSAPQSVPIRLGGQIEKEHPQSKPAKSAEKNSTERDILKSGHVLKVVELNLDTEVDVYDLEVECDHCYFANGILVSNSNYADCFQYCCSAVTHVEAVGDMKGALQKHKEIVENRRLKI